ncbi:hypothetical protein B4135_2116 [Caldibacillus debilis]|uniref:Uncharacterized protein n=1 Tax=Caldibacillus debilis TaxID=301148 RepID=A0A150M4Q8_9BACI|nr:hypothetical protein B4135_2116 [Caldibacillus debilis]
MQPGNRKNRVHGFLHSCKGNFDRRSVPLAFLYSCGGNFVLKYHLCSASTCMLVILQRKPPSPGARPAKGNGAGMPFPSRKMRSPSGRRIFPSPARKRPSRRFPLPAPDAPENGKGRAWPLACQKRASSGKRKKDRRRSLLPSCPKAGGPPRRGNRPWTRFAIETIINHSRKWILPKRFFLVCNDRNIINHRKG